MRTLVLGESGIDVSALCLGTLPFGTKVSEEDSFALLDGYFEAGGSFLDTANNYSKWHPGGKGGESETVIGRWVKKRGNRSRVVLASKVGFNNDDIGRSLSAKAITGELDKTLARLGTDYVDLYYAHDDVREDGLEETLEAFDRAVTAGKARLLGCSNYRAWRIERARNLSTANGWARYVCVQQRFTYLRPRPGASFAPQTSANEDLLDYCAANPEVRMLAYSPLLAGSYVRDDKPLPDKYHTVETEPRLATLRAVAGECGATVPQVIYAWMMLRSPAIIPISAPTTGKQLAENLGSLAVKLSQEQIARLDAPA